MMTIRSGGLIVKGPSETEIYLMDWSSEHLVAGMTISTSAWAFTRLSGATTGLMMMDNETILAGSRTTHARFFGGTEGQTYDVTNTIVTNETPARTKDRSFKVLIQDR